MAKISAGRRNVCVTASATLLLAMHVAHASSGTSVGEKLYLVADGPVVAQIAGSTFSWANQAGASILQSAKGAKPLTIDQPVHPGATNQAALFTVMASGPACYGTLFENPDIGSTYNGGMFMENTSTGMTTIFQNIYANAAGSNNLVQTETSFVGSSQTLLNSYGADPSLLPGEHFFLRICTDGSNVTFSTSPTGQDSSFSRLRKNAFPKRL